MEDQEREAERDIAGGFQGYRVCQDASLEIFHSLTAESRLGDGKERAGSASGSYPASRSLLSALSLSHDSFQAGCSFRRKGCRCRTVSLTYSPVPLPVLISLTGNITSLLLKRTLVVLVKT